MTDRNRIIYLLEKYAEKEATEAEEKELFAILNQVEHDSALQNEVAMIFEEMEPAHMTANTKERILKNVLAPGLTIPITTRRKEKSHAQTRRIFTWQRVAAAAAVILMIGTGTYFLFFKTGKNEIAKTEKANPIQIQNDVAPGGNKAVLTLADGSAIILDSAANGTLTQQGNTKILKKDGQLAYNSLNEKSTEVLYNTITTPRGGQYQLVLSDGSKVWLNAASSIRFPVVFTGMERSVVITGEAYFEVAKNKTMPFKVKATSSEIKVLGTHFNVNAYDDEASIKTTLLEGMVRVSVPVLAGNQSPKFLHPGQQAGINKEGKINVMDNADTEEAVAWKNGRFQFKSTDLKTILRQIARWYDVDVEYKGNVNLHFTGQLTRNENVSKVFEQLALTGEVHFKIDGKRIIVSP